jgi:hypothetical protein
MLSSWDMLEILFSELNHRMEDDQFGKVNKVNSRTILGEVFVIMGYLVASFLSLSLHQIVNSPLVCEVEIMLRGRMDCWMKSQSLSLVTWSI